LHRDLEVGVGRLQMFLITKVRSPRKFRATWGSLRSNLPGQYATLVYELLDVKNYEVQLQLNPGCAVSFANN